MNGQQFPVANTNLMHENSAVQDLSLIKGDPIGSAQETSQGATLGLHPLLANIEHYVVVLSAGDEDLGKRATLAFSTACTAQAMELDTQVFLIGDGAHWAYQKNTRGIHQQGFPALDDLIGSFVEMEGKIYLCSACDAVCAVATEQGGEPLVRHPTIQPRGLASILEHMVGGSSVTF